MSKASNLAGFVTSITPVNNLNVGVVTATTFVGSGSGLTGIITSVNPVGQTTTSQAGTTTINLSLGSVIYFTHNTDTTVAFANTATTQEITFIRTKDDTTTARNIIWPTSVRWPNVGAAPILQSNPGSGDAQTFKMVTRDGGVNWYAWQEQVYSGAGAFLFGVGGSNLGGLGLNNTIYYSSPVQIPGTTWSSINTTGQHSLATKTDGTLWSWGLNNSGQLGQNNLTYRSSPVQIPGTTWSLIAVGSNYTIATKTDGTLWGWGSNGAGGLGQNNVTPSSSPIQIPGTTWNKITAGAGGVSSLATKTDGTLWAWGSNSRGQLGLNNTTYRSSPVQIPGTTWNSINTNGQHTVATKTDGTLWSWGRNNQGQLGQNNGTYASSPIQIPGTTWNRISAANNSLGHYSLATKTDNTLWSWGTNANGQLGQNNLTQYSSPVQIPGTTWSSISSSYTALATKTDGTLWSWGQNSGGQQGQSNTYSSSSPVQIPGTGWTTISAGGNISFATYIVS